MDSLNDQVIKKSPQLQDEIKRLIIELKNAMTLSESDKRLLYQTTSARLVTIINEFELQPKLLEKQLGSYINDLCALFLEDDLAGDAIGNVIYTFAKVCTFKTVALFFSSDVYLFDRLIEKCNDSNEAVRFVSLLWLSNLVLVPFPIETIGNDIRKRLVDGAQISLTTFTNISRTQVAASILYSRLLSRPDCKHLLDSYFERVVTTWPRANSSQKLGTLMIVNKLLKRVELSQEQTKGVYSCIIGDILVSQISNSSLIYSIKVLCKIAVNYIKHGLFENVAEVINNLINDILLSDVTFETNLRYAMAKAMAAIVAQLSFAATNYQSQLVQFIVDLINTDETNVPKIHTTLLTLGYVSLSKNLPMPYQTSCIQLASRFLFFRIPKGTVSIGNQVRDSACFLIWSIVRNLKHSSPLISTVLVNLLQMLVFDELLLKRCSVAVIQEILGRLGSELVNTANQGEFIVNFVSKLGLIRLNQNICYDFIESFYYDIDLSFLVAPLVDVICEQDGNGVYLNKLLQQPEAMELVPKSVIDFNDIVCRLKGANKWHVLFQLDAFEEGYQQFDDFVFDESKLDMIKGYFYSLRYKQLTESDWHNVLNISRHANLFEELKQVISNQDGIPIQEILHYLPHDLNLSRTIFNSRNIDVSQYESLLSLMKDPHVNYAIRANLIDNLAANVPPCFKVQDIYSLFDDYTTTDQGDVGSKVRIATINLVVKNNLIDGTVKLKLIRLSGELMDRIRYLSFKALTGESFSWRRFFLYKLELKEHQCKVEFWKGVAFTTGSVIGNTKIINESFREMLRYGPNDTDFDIWLAFLKRPEKGDKRQAKLVSSVLQLILKLLDANYHFECPVNYHSLFVKCYNLHINTKNSTRVSAILQIFLHISQRCPQLRSRIYGRFLWILTNHPSQELKAFVGEHILFELVDGKDLLSRYELLDWFDITQSDLLFIKSVLE
ncbi:hypothetical protein KGF57_002702 [Candida theae]|uniref:Tubulin-folding cofactor D ARM repeats domain-containing protein n=1 Tax=Candida theae TaxID=1198502 RepID=A0AAD5BEU8_9ASCO|nr:uncharacterized protein KGF57_002702 [Candida theae]KAI5958346.1 hypothetical protein KGF57_002702 [Candida theae]